ncbi:MAG: PilZ domain-containing protein [Deltaproteobacteria bacterium]|nr:PilZ domain-containing protein [Deltaproteobacteria bacterium]
MSTWQASTPQGSRRSIRRAVSLGCELVAPRSDEVLRYRATDLSVAGMWLQTAEPVRAGEIVVVCFTPADGGEVELQVFASVARVMTARGATDETPGVGMGLELLDLRTEERDRLDRWLATFTAPVPRRRRPLVAGPITTQPALGPGLAKVAAASPLPRLASCWR